MRLVLLAFLASTLALSSAALATRQHSLSDTSQRDDGSFVVQVPSRDGFVHLRLSSDIGSALPAIKGQLEALPNVRLGDPADYELTTMRDYPQALIAIDQHQDPSDWERDFSGPPPYEFPRTVLLGNLLLNDYGPPLRELIARASAAKFLMSLGLRGKSAEIESCLDPVVAGSACPVGASASEATPGSPSPQVADWGRILLRSRATGPRYVAVYVIDPAFDTHRLAFSKVGSLVRISPGQSLELEALETAQPNKSGRFEVVTIWSERPFNPDALPRAIQPPQFSTSFAQYRTPSISSVGVGGGSTALPGMASFIAQFYSTMVYNAADRLKDVDKVNERGTTYASHRCGASLVAPDLVVTAAHCVAKGKYFGSGLQRVAQERRVRTDSYHLGSGGETYAIAGVAVPTEYKPDTSENDIALLLLSADKGDRRMPAHVVAIAHQSPRAGTPLEVFGWGFTAAERLRGDIDLTMSGAVQKDPADLQIGNVDAIGRDECRRLMGSDPKIGEGMLCTAAPKGAKHNVFTCVGDSGGPLVRVMGKREELVGIVSWSKGCGYKQYPDVYTDVARYGAWIDAARKQLKPGVAIYVPLPQQAATSRRH